MKFNIVSLFTLFLLAGCSGSEKPDANDKSAMAVASNEKKTVQDTQIEVLNDQEDAASDTDDAQEKRVGVDAKAEVKAKKKKRPKFNIPAPDDLTSPPSEATISEMGVQSITIIQSKGKTKPQKNDWVEISFTGWTSQGEAFTSSLPSKRTRISRLESLPKALQEGLKNMVVGEKKRLWVPIELAPKGQLDAPTAVVYDIELVAVKAEPPSPKNLTPPKRAKTTESGLSYRIIRKSKSRNAKRPTETSTNSVHITQWNATGRLIMSTVLQGRPMSFRMNHRQFPPALWKEAASLLRLGEKGRFWIPVDKTSRNRKMGNTIMEMELLAIKEPPKRKTDTKRSK